MADIDYFSDLRIDPQAAAAPPEETDYFADLRVEPKGWIEGAAQGALNTGKRAMSRLQQMGSQFMLEQTAGRAADRGKSFGDILQEEKLQSGMTDMQGKPLETNTGEEYVSAAMRWIDARYADLIGTDDKAAADEYAASMQKHMDAVAATPKSQVAQNFERQAIVKDATLGQTLGNFGAAILDNPVGGLSWALETAGESAPQIGAAVAGGVLTRNPAVGVGLMGGTSYATERYVSPGEFFAEKGLDLNKPEDRERLLNDPKMMQEAAQRGVIRGIVIGAFDMLSGGVAGKTLMANPFAEAVAQTLTQGILGAGGEAGGRLFSGQEMDWGEVVAEGLAETVTLPFDMLAASRGEQPAPPPPPPGAVPPGAVPPGAEPAETIIPPEEPPGGPPAAPAAVVPTPAPAPTPAQAAVDASIDERFAREMEVPDSPRLTELDRRSPIPNEIIDTGKAAVEAATGQPSTFTTTAEIDGKREVVTGKVSDLVSQNRAETAAVTSQIMAGVSTPEILAGTQPAAPPARAAEVPAPTVPTGVPATPRPSIGRRLPGRTLEEGMQKLKARSAAYDAEIAELATTGESVKMVSNTDPGKRVMIGPDMSEPGMFRVTYFDEQGAVGHTQHNTMEQAARDVIGSYHPVGNIARQVVKRDVAVTPGGREVPVVYAVVEAGDLVTSQRDEGGANPAYPQELQPRDRSRGTSDVQINEIAQNLDPRLLDNNVSASDGAPIISADGVVESGNGRVLAIRRAYSQGMPTAQGYKDYLASQGYPVEPFTNPVLVRVRQGQLEQGERAAFTREANERTTMALSATERAMADAAAMSPETVGLFRGGEITEAGNRDFVRSFMQSVVSPNEQGAMVTPDGELSQEAIRRVQAALLARAFGDPDLVGALVESTDNNIKAIGHALMDVAGLWSQMRAEAADGRINPGAEITPNLLEAVRLVQRARNEGRALAELVGQKDIFTGTAIPLETEAVLRLMFRNTASWTQPAGREKLAEALRFYATEARKTSAGIDLLGEKAPAASRILEEAKKRQYGQEETQAKLPGGGRVAGKDTGAPSRGRAVEAQPRPQAAGRPSPAPEAPAQEVREAAEAAAKEAGLPRPKFSLPANEPPPRRLTVREKLIKKLLKKRLSSDEIAAAEAAMNAIPETYKEEGYGTDEWWAKRRYNSNGEKVTKAEYISRLYEGAKALAVKEINEARIKINQKRAEKGLPPLDLPQLPTYEVANKRIAVLIMGPPAAGKSTVANAIAYRLKAAISDVDEAKKGIPGYEGGIGANAVHTESSELGADVTSMLMAEGSNLIVPTVGDKHGKIDALRLKLEAEGYTVHLVLMDVSPSTAVQRMLGRFNDTGRLIPPIYFLDVVWKPPHIFQYAQQKGKFASYARIESNNFSAARVSEATGEVSVVALGEQFVSAGEIRPRGFRDSRSSAERIEEIRIAEQIGEPVRRVGGGAGRPGFIRPSGKRTRREAPRFKKAPVTAERRTQVGTLGYVTKDSFAPKAAAFLKSFRKILDGYGLKGVSLDVWEDILLNGNEPVEGLYLPNLIEVAASRGDPNVTLHHEVIHALFNLALSVREKAVLLHKSRRDWVTPQIKHDYSEFDTRTQAEEGVAHAYTAWLAGQKFDGVITKSFKKIQTYLKGLYQALTGHDIRSAEDIFRQIQSGKIGRRTQAGRGVEITAVTPAFAKGYTPYQPAGPTPGALPGISTREWEALSPGMRREIARTVAKTAPTETVDMFEGPREQFVIPGAEKVSEATLARRRAEAPLRPTTGQMGTEGLPLFGDGQNQLALFKKEPSGPNDPRFKLGSAPHSAGQAQQVQQGFLNRGQPVDRAIRTPFNLLGGLDEQNRWRPGKRLSDKMGPAGRQGLGIGGVIGAGIGTVVGGPVGGAVGFAAGGTVGTFILGSSPSPTGKFAWFHGIAENAKRGLIDGYGLDPAYLDVYRKSELGKTAILREAQGILKVLSNAGVGTQEAKVLQAVLTGENITDADMVKLSVPIRKAIDDLGAEAVSLGLISAESFERNRGAYLHRIYAKNEVDQSNLAGWVSARMTSRRKKILGDQLKGRGIFMDVEADRLMRDVESFKQGARGAPVQGEKFRVIDEVSSVADLTGGAPKEKTLRRVYLPAGEAVPAKYRGANWIDRGQWEVRKAGKKPTLWRDYTKAEREKMGELVDARYTVAKTFMLMANDLSTGRFFKDVSEKEEWTQSTPPPDGQWKEGSEYSRYWEDPEIRWVKVPDTAIEKTGGKKRWGALAGKFVRAEIWRDLNEVDIANRPGTWRVLLTQWKKNKTARNPVVHMNNVISNVMFMDLADVRTQDLVGGIAAYVKGTKDFQEALENGAFGGDMVSAEIRDEVLKPILEEISKQQTGAGNPFLKRAGIVGTVLDKLWTKAKQIDNGMLRAYQAEDQLFRMAAYMRRRSQGESPRVAAMNARDQFLNYDIRAPWVVMARNSLFPFISYTYRAVPKLAENIMHRPWKIAKYAAIAYAVNALAYMLDEGDDDEDRERAALRDEEQGYSWLGTPRMLRMPWRDKNGLPVFLDVRRWIPAGDIFDTTQGSSALPIPGPLHFGGPLQMAFEFMLNKQAFTGEEITNELTMDNREKFSSVADWAWKSWAPASFWTPWSWHWTKIANAVYGATDTAGHPYSVPQAFLSSVGVKVKPVDVDDGIKWHYFDFRKVQNALKADFRSLSHRLERGLISQEAFDRGAARIMEKYENLGQRVQTFNKRIEKPEKVGG